MIVFLTSSPVLVDDDGRFTARLNPANGFVEALHRAWPAHARVLLVASDPVCIPMGEGMAADLREAFLAEELECLPFAILDDRTAGEAAALVAAADVIILAGGHVPTQNAFFARIGLAELLHDFDGTVIGISAGTMNCASTVYALPEEEGEAVDESYQRFLSGLGLTDTMVIPHADRIRFVEVDELLMIEDIAAEDSFGREFLLLPDGSYVLIGLDGVERVLGDAELLADARLRPLSRHECSSDDCATCGGCTVPEFEI